MARSLNKLNVRQVAAAKTPGRYSDGGGLYLRVTTSGSRSWVFMAAEGGKRQEIGLGSVNAVPLATARQLATAMREAKALGNDPREVIAPAIKPEAASIPTFGTFAEEYIASVEAGWRNPVHRQQWRSSLRDHAALLRDVCIDKVDTEQLLLVLRPIWQTKTETAKRVRGRIERILDAAKARGHRPSNSINPAAWRGHLSVLLPPPSKLARGHHPALPYREAPAFIAELRTRTALAARCLEFVILTAARSGEALEASWAEVDLEAALWTIPAKRMKAGVQHVVPLSPPAIEMLRALKTDQSLPKDRIFAVAGVARSNMAMNMLLRRMKRDNVTTHGFRSTFRDWAGDETDYPRELIEQALAHTIQNKAEQAYRRSTAIDRRRKLMDDWAFYLFKQ